MSVARLLADALRPLPAGYLPLAGRVVAAAERDDRVRALWLSGSVGRGVADAGSDLDVVVAVTPGDFGAFAESWPEWLAGITPTVLARELPGMPGSFYSVTPECLRLDVVAERAGQPQGAAPAGRLLVVAKDEWLAGGPPDPSMPAEAGSVPAGPGVAGPAAGPDPARLAGLVEEALRQLAIFPAAVVAREDWLLGVVGVQNIQLMLYQLFVESNQPLPPMGIKQWSARLTPAQRRICAALPPAAASRDGVITAMRAAAAAFRRAARQALAAGQVPWPADFDTAVQRYWQAGLGWTE